MRLLDIIIKKRDNIPLTYKEINYVAALAANGRAPDYQLSAFLMACYLNPLSNEEAACLTKAMAYGGLRLDFKNIKKPKVDKHSTGGVGDGVSLALAPLAAACGLAVPMMSGRGLGHTGGTLDKLESVKNFNVRVAVSKINKQMKALGVCMFGQTAYLAPADKKLYSLRDASGTVESIPLIVASILSKKYAEGVDSLVMDVKYGCGAFMKNYQESKKLASALVKTAKLLGLKCRALLSAMEQPLGRAVGNANEMLQSIMILKGDKNIAPDFYELLIETAAHMLEVSGKVKNMTKARALAERCIEDGSAAEKMRQIIKWQGGDADVFDNPQKHLQNAKLEYIYKAPSSGYIGAIDACMVGNCAVLLGAGRSKMEDIIDHKAGLWLDKKYGDFVNKGDVIARIYASDKTKLAEGKTLFARAVKIQKSRPAKKPLIKEIIS